MTQEQILEGNKLIAEFMGGKLKQPNKEHPNNPYNKHTWWGVGENKTVGHFSLHYHSSWDWLMPVIDKINIGLSDTLGYVDIKATEIASYSSGSLKRKLPAFVYIENGRRFNGNEKLLATFRVVIEFIKWYNTKK